LQAWRSFGPAAADYELGRPGWPPKAIDVLGIPREATVLDLAAGTGKLTRRLVERFARVIAVEPLDEMRAVLQELVPGAEALAGEAEAIPLEDASVDAVFVAEAFHWFGGPDAVAEIARVLRPRGPLVLLWNERGGSAQPPLPEQFRRRVRERREAGAEWPFGHGKWRAAVEAGPFGPIQQASFPNSHQHDHETLLASARSWSWIASLPDDERERELQALDELLPDGRWTMPIRTDVYWAAREEQSRAHFDRLASDYDRLRAAEGAPIVAAELADLGLRGRRVLDVGCGTGALLAALASEHQVTGAGVDASPEMIAVAGRNVPPEIDVVTAPAEALPFADASFERALMIFVVHHLDRPAAFREALRVLVPAGRLLIRSTDPETVHEFWLAGLFPSYASIEQSRFPSAQTLRRELTEAGFVEVACRSSSIERSFSRAEALAKLRGRAYSTAVLLPEDEYNEGIERAERELPDTIRYTLRLLVVTGDRPGL
jgi:ubiquinone/menaquinone biosynthesis C-methylase UbiE